MNVRRPKSLSSGSDKQLGMQSGITRRDFLNGAAYCAVAAGISPRPAMANAMPLVDEWGDWYGYGGVGDYADCHGNTPDVISAAHRLRDGEFQSGLRRVIETSEVHDLVVVGGGIAGLAACRRFRSEANDASALIIDNHPLAGGSAKRNEFLVDGVRLFGPQASNASALPHNRNSWYGRLWDDLGLPHEYSYQPASGAARGLRVARDNYLYSMLNADERVDTGFFFSGASARDPRWVINPAKDQYRSLRFSPAVNEALWKLKTGVGPDPVPSGGDAWLDSVTLTHYLENVLGMPPEVTSIYSELIALNCGVGADAVSALVGKKLFVRFFEGFEDCCLPFDFDPARDYGVISFPGGNETVTRHFLKALRPDAISGGSTPDEIFSGRLNVERFDNSKHDTRIRLGSTVVAIQHDGEPGSAKSVSVVYHKAGKLYRVRARAVVSAVGAWVNKRVVRDLDKQHRDAFAEPQHGSNLVVNVALRNWRPMAKLGITACHYFTTGGLGIYCNIREPMRLGKDVPPFDPDCPVVLTFYIGFPSRGSAREQAVRARTKLLQTDFPTFERQFRVLLNEMFGPHGFDAKKDIAGIVLNRWGHSYIVPEPGFWYGRDGRQPIAEVMGQPLGRIAFAHSEMAGIQSWEDAARFGERAAEHALDVYAI